MAIPAAVYGVLSFLPAGLLAYLMNRRRGKGHNPVARGASASEILASNKQD
jgi:hypothetical protein